MSTIQEQLDVLSARITTIADHSTRVQNQVEEHVIEAKQRLSQTQQHNQLQDAQLSYMQDQLNRIAQNNNRAIANISYYDQRQLMDQDHMDFMAGQITSYSYTNEDEHQELHEECRLLSYALGESHERLVKASYAIDALPNKIVCTEEDYDKIAYKDANTFYYLYDPEDELDL